MTVYTKEALEKAKASFVGKPYYAVEKVEGKEVKRKLGEVTEAWVEGGFLKTKIQLISGDTYTVNALKVADEDLPSK